MAGIETDFTMSNRYRLLRRVRVGTAGDVWEAQDQRSANRVIDIEIFSDDPVGDPGFVERRRRGIEWLLWPWFLHPSAPRILQYGEEGPIRFVVLEHLEGETLAERLDHGGPMKPADAARMAAEIAEAIQKAHDIGFVHGELRTENILITREGATKVLELGFTPAAWEGGTLPNSENQQGADRERPQEPRLKPEPNEKVRLRDLHALGMVLYQMLTGRPLALRPEVGGGQGEPLPVALVAPWVSRDLAEVCEAAVSADPRVRPPTAAALASVLRTHAAAPLAPSRNTGREQDTILVVEDATPPSVKIHGEELVPTRRKNRRSVRSAAKAARRSAHAERAAQKKRARANRAAQDEAARAAKAREREEQAWREAEERRVREEAARREAEERARVEAERLATEETTRREAERLATEETTRREAERLATEETARREAERLATEETARREAERVALEERAAVEAEEGARRGAEERARREAEQAGRLGAERRAVEEAARLDEAERRAAEEAARLQAERRAVEEAARLEAERRAAEEAARLQAEERARQKAEERARLEAARLAAEAGDALHQEDRRIEAELRAVAIGAAEPMSARAAQKELRRKAKQEAKADRKAKKELHRKARK
jgi:hypothetical protein